MAKLTKIIELIERIDKMIARKATGSPQELAERLNISRASLHRVIDVMKFFGAPIEYRISCQSYIYTCEVAFYCGFYAKKLSSEELQAVNGGFTKFRILTNINMVQGFSLKK